MMVSFGQCGAESTNDRLTPALMSEIYNRQFADRARLLFIVFYPTLNVGKMGAG
jgi:hypothetical protein